MATVFFVRDGTGDQHTSRGHEVSMADAMTSLEPYETKYFESGPTINEGVASGYAPFKYVVLEVSEGETNAKFPEQGYYLLVGLSVEDCLKLLGIDSVMDV